MTTFGANNFSRDNNISGGTILSTNTDVKLASYLIERSFVVNTVKMRNSSLLLKLKSLASLLKVCDRLIFALSVHIPEIPVSSDCDAERYGEEWSRHLFVRKCRAVAVKSGRHSSMTEVEVFGGLSLFLPRSQLRCSQVFRCCLPGWDSGIQRSLARLCFETRFR